MSDKVKTKCIDCGKEREITKASLARIQRGERSGRCRQCSTKLRFPNPIKDKKTYKKKYYLQNKEKFNKRSRKNYQDNKEKYFAQSKKWIKKNPNEAKKIKAKYRKKNREILRKKSREYRANFRKKFPIKAKYREYKDAANRRGLIFDLTLKEFREFIESDCFYCGEKAGGIDRVDNTKGYLKSNSVPCCFICNRMKFKYSLEDFINHCRKVVDYSE